MTGRERISKSLVSVGKGPEAKSQSHSTSLGNVCGRNKRRTSGGGMFEKSLSGKLDSTL
jgi:hypothetical protein